MLHHYAQQQTDGVYKTPCANLDFAGDIFCRTHVMNLVGKAKFGRLICILSERRCLPLVISKIRDEIESTPGRGSCLSRGVSVSESRGPAEELDYLTSQVSEDHEVSRTSNAA